MNLTSGVRGSVTVRFFLIAVIALSMLIPLAMVDGVSTERQRYFDETMDEVAAAWGDSQVVSGPFLVIPETHAVEVHGEQESGVRQEVIRERIVLPEELDLKIEISHEIRRRAIYEVPVYTATVHIQGRFPAPDVVLDGDEHVYVQPGQARIVVGISQPRAIVSATDLHLESVAHPFESGTGQSWVGNGIQAALSGYDGRSDLPFDFQLIIKGTRELGFAAVGGTMRVAMDATWPHPGFHGGALPDRHEIHDQGFRAQWSFSPLGRSLPASFVPDLPDVAPAPDISRVRLFQPVTGYTNVDRAIKYGLLFVAMTFVVFICFELTLALRFHPVQYGVVGAGLVLFYLVLLALSEHMDFGVAYLGATLTMTALMSAYVGAITRIRSATVWIAVILISLYATLYLLLMLETYALLVGTSVLLAGLAALMFATRSLARLE